jgi:hypothetical protein
VVGSIYGRAHQTRLSGRLFCLGFNEVAQFLSKSEVSFHRCFLQSFGSFGQAVSEEKIFKKSTNQKQELSVVAMFVNGSGRNEQSL